MSALATWASGVSMDPLGLLSEMSIGVPFLDRCVPLRIPSPADLWDRFCLPMAPGSGPASLFALEGPRKRSKSVVKSSNSLASSGAGVKRSSRMTGYIGEGKRGSNQRDDGEEDAG